MKDVFFFSFYDPHQHGRLDDDQRPPQRPLVQFQPDINRHRYTDLQLGPIPRSPQKRDQLLSNPANVLRLLHRSSPQRLRGRDPMASLRDQPLRLPRDGL